MYHNSSCTVTHKIFSKNTRIESYGGIPGNFHCNFLALQWEVERKWRPLQWSKWSMRRKILCWSSIFVQVCGYMLFQRLKITTKRRTENQNGRNFKRKSMTQHICTSEQEKLEIKRCIERPHETAALWSMSISFEANLYNKMHFLHILFFKMYSLILFCDLMAVFYPVQFWSQLVA